MAVRERSWMRTALMAWLIWFTAAGLAVATQAVNELPLAMVSITSQLDGNREWEPTPLWPEREELLPPAPDVSDAPPPIKLNSIQGLGLQPNPAAEHDATSGLVVESVSPPPETVMPIEVADLPPPPKRPMIGFELHRDATTWLVGNGDDFGFFSLESISTLQINQMDGWFSGYAAHFLSGPVQTDMPPRLFELFVGYRMIKDVNIFLTYDLTVSGGIYTDFEGHAHQGWQLRGLGLAKLHVSHSTDFVVGVAYLDRDNLRMLPVGGLVINVNRFTRLELVYPEPRLTTGLTYGNSGQGEIYVRGQFGGGSWAIERDSLASDIATYDDYRIFLGISGENDEGQSTFFEVGYVFDRSLEYRSGIGNLSLGDRMMLRSGVRY